MTAVVVIVKTTAIAGENLFNASQAEMLTEANVFPIYA